MTPAEFYYAYLGWADLEHSRLKQAWERERWSVWISTIIQLDKKDRANMTVMFPLPWESQDVEQTRELTQEERKERVAEILKITRSE